MIIENEVDGLSLRTFSNADVEKLLPGKIGPAKKLILLIDILKARHAGPAIHGGFDIQSEASPTSGNGTTDLQFSQDKTSEFDIHVLDADKSASSASTDVGSSIPSQKLV